MNKKSIFGIALNLVFLAVFNAVFFIIGGTERPASVWISYGFIHFAYLMFVATPFLVRKSSSAAIFGFSLKFISSAYFVIELVAGVIFIILKGESFKLALAVQIILAGIYTVLLISHLIANENTADSIEQHEYEVAFIKNAASRVKLLEGKSTDRRANKEIEKAYDLLHSSPTRTVATVRSLEEQINDKISELEYAVASNNAEAIIRAADEIAAITEERNRKLRIAN